MKKQSGNYFYRKKIKFIAILLIKNANFLWNIYYILQKKMQKNNTSDKNIAFNLLLLLQIAFNFLVDESFFYI